MSDQPPTTAPTPHQPAEQGGVRGVLRAFWLLAPTVLAMGVCLFALLAGADALYRRDSKRVELASGNQNTIDYLIVNQQFERVAQAKPASVALFGDSSCLMGVDPHLLGEALHGRTVQSYCMLGYLGPEGYAPAVQRLISGPARPDTIVLMLHPVQYTRDPGWEGWVSFAQTWTANRKPTQAFPYGGLDYIRLNLLGRPLFEPLPGAYGVFYGGEAQFLDTIQGHAGSAFDPGHGLTQRSLAEVEAIARGSTPQDGEDFSYSRNDAFRQALLVLREVIQSFGPERVLLVVSPIPADNLGAEGAAEREAAGREIASMLGLPESNLLATPPALPGIYFSSQTHLSRWGKQRFSQLLGEALAQRLHPQ